MKIRTSLLTLHEFNYCLVLIIQFLTGGKQSFTLKNGEKNKTVVQETNCFIYIIVEFTQLLLL